MLLTAYQAPNMNAHAERFVRSIKVECLNQMILLGKDTLDRATAEYVEHYHDERAHQGIGNEIVSGTLSQSDGSMEIRERLGGLLNYYYRRVASVDRVFGHYGIVFVTILAQWLFSREVAQNQACRKRSNTNTIAEIAGVMEW